MKPMPAAPVPAAAWRLSPIAGVRVDASRNAAMALAVVPLAASQQMPQTHVPGADVNGPHVMIAVFHISDGDAALALTGLYTCRAYPLAVAYSLMLAPAIVRSVD